MNPEFGTSKINQLWHSTDEAVWREALDRYWHQVRPSHLEVEREMARLQPDDIRQLDAGQWYDWLRNKYYFWKYTAPNRYATTTARLDAQAKQAGRHHLLAIRDRLLGCENADIEQALRTATEFAGLGPPGASGLLAVLFPAKFGAIDQFVVQALQKIPDLPEREMIHRMKPDALTIRDGVVVISVLRRKARELNELFQTAAWTPRKIDMVLWANDRE